MDNKKFESPEEVQAFFDSGEFADGFKNWLATLLQRPESVQYFEGLESPLRNFEKVAAPKISNIILAFKKWTVNIEILGKVGWLPHYTMPFEDIAEWEGDNEDIQRRVLNYYEDKWNDIRSTMEKRLSYYKADEHAKAVFHEALNAHECGLYRLVCPALFSAIERVFRAGKVGPINSVELIGNLVNDDSHIENFIYTGYIDLHIIPYLMKGLEVEKVESKKGTQETKTDWPEWAGPIFGIYKSIFEKKDLHILEQGGPVPNRHAAIHGLVVYSSPQNSLNAIFLADNIFRIVTHFTSVPSSPQ